MAPDASYIAGLFANAVRQHQSGQLDEAERLYRQILDADPRHADSLHLLGVMASQRGRQDLAIDRITRAIGLDATVSSYHCNLAAVYQTAGRLDRAIGCYCKILELKPNDRDAHNNLANALLTLDRLEEAMACYRRIIDLEPNDPATHYNLGLALQKQGRLEEAARCYRRTIDIAPGHLKAHNNLGLVLQDLGRLEEAVDCHRRAADIEPNFAATHNNLGIVLQEQGCVPEAIGCFRKALCLKPDYAEAHNNLGAALEEIGGQNDVIACYRKALVLEPNFAEAHKNLGMALLARGNLPAGWREYEWRWKTPAMTRVRRDFMQPQWSGEAADDRTLLIHGEQGFGDTLQFCRFAALAGAQGWRVVMEVQRPLVRLLAGFPGLDRVIGRGDALPPFDLHCPMLSLPLALGTTLVTIPSAASYLRADDGEIATWRRRLAALPDRSPRIGVVWAGNRRARHPHAAAIDRRRSIAPERLSPLFTLTGLHFFSLQKDEPSAPKRFPLIDVMDEMEDFASTAALIANLDLVISVDTAVAHLAAALGKPVWLLDRADSCWRWFRNREDSPWYPSLRLFRQPKRGDWSSVIENVRIELQRFAENRQPEQREA
ncbi:tetratricopeptide repeat protein [Telmatospirillum sp.]|uniref:tetratricopeptide repeat protein n=1 Tax=Telmatospirillum sp. TaxID=2079197 RepID=UPI0028449DE2|nr:tetratricopeptide repeat protein [Telmatospirillum sp.]MDR3438044.1 tetratricopeptide repeat protein [Telmatospirillum sp.]